MPLYEESCTQCGCQFEHYDVFPNTISPPCPKCGSETERLVSVYNPRVWESYTTNNIYPDGRPVTIKGPGQLAQLENEYHVTRLDDPKMDSPQTKPKEFYDPLGGPEPEGGVAPFDPKEFE